MPISESQVQQQIADYLRIQYPEVIFHSDTGSITRLTPRQGAMRKRQNGGRRAWPDMFIAEPLVSSKHAEWKFGLFIELKRDGTRLKKKDGSWASDHIAEQAEMLERLEFRGYRAVFAVGFDEAKQIIDDYLRR